MIQSRWKSKVVWAATVLGAVLGALSAAEVARLTGLDLDTARLLMVVLTSLVSNLVGANNPTAVGRF